MIQGCQPTDLSRMIGAFFLDEPEHLLKAELPVAVSCAPNEAG